MLISPSLLAANFANLEKEVQRVELSGCTWIHLDVMDAHFVPNLSFGAPVIKALRPTTKLVFDVHLMMTHPLDYIKDYVDAGSEYICVHFEAIQIQETGIKESLELIKSFGVKAGLAIQPNTTYEEVEPFLQYCDIILVMSVYAGFGGQSFIEESVDKIAKINQYKQLNNLDLIINVDGGINDITGKKCVEAGANCLVAGSYLFTDDMESKVASLK